MKILNCLPRLSDWLIVTICLMTGLALIQPNQMPVILYKLALVTLAAVLGYWIDRALFPYARPHEQLRKATRTDQDPAILAAFYMIRRAGIVFAVVLGLTLGL